MTRNRVRTRWGSESARGEGARLAGLRLDDAAPSPLIPTTKTSIISGFYLGTQENTIVFSFVFITNFLTSFNAFFANIFLLNLTNKKDRKCEIFTFGLILSKTI